MRPMLSTLVAFLLIIVVVHHSSASIEHINKRYYDTWDSNNDVNNNGYDESIKIFPFRQKSSKKEDPCANKPLWYLKYQARLGKLSPFYDCLGYMVYKQHREVPEVLNQ